MAPDLSFVTSENSSSQLIYTHVFLDISLLIWLQLINYCKKINTPSSPLQSQNGPCPPKFGATEFVMLNMETTTQAGYG